MSTPENRGWIGGIGVGVGYLGSFVGIITGMLMLQKWNMSMPALFTVTGLLFLLFALPSFFWIRERGNPRVRRFNMASVARPSGRCGTRSAMPSSTPGCSVS